MLRRTVLIVSPYPSLCHSDTNRTVTDFLFFSRSGALGSLELSAEEGPCYGAETGEGGWVGRGGEVLGVERGAGEAVFVGERL